MADPSTSKSTANPASRLHEILDLARKKKGESQTRNVWSEILVAEDEDQSLFLHRLTQLHDLPGAIEDLVRDDGEVDEALFLSWRKGVLRGIDISNLNAPWKTYSVHLTPETMISLRFCADHLSRKKPEPSVPDSSLSQIKTKADQLYTEVEASDLSPVLKDYLTGLLIDFLIAIEGVKLTGLRGIESQVEATVGELLLRRKTFSEVEKSGVGKKVLAWLAALAMTISAANDGWDLGAKALPFLTPYLKESSSVESNSND